MAIQKAPSPFVVAERAGPRAAPGLRWGAAGCLHGGGAGSRGRAGAAAEGRLAADCETGTTGRSSLHTRRAPQAVGTLPRREMLACRGGAMRLVRGTAHLAAGPRPAPCRSVAAAAGGGLEPPDVRKLAQMAHIDITDEEVGRFGGRGGGGGWW